MVEPNVKSTHNMPVSSIAPRKQLANDFPSQHSKRSFLKLEPIAQRRPPKVQIICDKMYRIKSVETRHITPDNYLSESLRRHRDADASLLKDYLNVREKDVNKEWNKPGRPGPKVEISSIIIYLCNNICHIFSATTPFQNWAC
jgi:hypothetical protein